VSVAPESAQKVLVVDDEWMNREIMETVLVSAGYQVFLANSPEMALAVAEMHQPSLALIDVRLPHEDDGYHLCRSFKEHPRFSTMRIAMITALDDENERRKARDAGADAFLTRLMSVSTLVDHVNNLLGS
jgi:DNA-binding response OmpR family regulator